MSYKMPAPPEQTPTADEPAKTVISQRDSQLIRHYLPAEVREMCQRVAHAIRDDYLHEPEVWVYGKQCNQPRDVQFRSRDSKGYFYSSQVVMAQPLSEDMNALIAWANNVTGSRYNGILINRYVDGTKTISAHSDNEVGLDPDGGVLCITHGAERTFRIREKGTKQPVKDVPARNGEAIQMKGDFQKHYTHEIPREATIKGERVSFTFRTHDILAESKLWDKHMKEVEEKNRTDDARKERKRALNEQLEKIKAERAAKEEKEKADGERIKRKRKLTEHERGAVKRIALVAQKEKEQMASLTKLTDAELAKMKRSQA